jgi:hypothetical protein
MIWCHQSTILEPSRWSDVTNQPYRNLLDGPMSPNNLIGTSSTNRCQQFTLSEPSRWSNVTKQPYRNLLGHRPMSSSIKQPHWNLLEGPDVSNWPYWNLLDRPMSPNNVIGTYSADVTKQPYWNLIDPHWNLLEGLMSAIYLIGTSSTVRCHQTQHYNKWIVDKRLYVTYWWYGSILASAFV